MTENPTARQPGSLAELVAPAVEAAGMYFESVTVAGDPGQRSLQVVVDRPEGTAGLDLDDVAAVATAVSEALDAAGDHLPELGSEPYQLEVSSPGVSRPLTEPRHWRRNVGRMVTVSLGDRRSRPASGRRTSPAWCSSPCVPGPRRGCPPRWGSPNATTTTASARGGCR